MPRFNRYNNSSFFQRGGRRGGGPMDDYVRQLISKSTQTDSSDYSVGGNTAKDALGDIGQYVGPLLSYAAGPVIGAVGSMLINALNGSPVIGTTPATGANQTIGGTSDGTDMPDPHLDGGAPLDTDSMTLFFGGNPVPLPPLRKPPFAVTFTLKWPAYPSGSFANYLLNHAQVVEGDGCMQFPVSALPPDIAVVTFPHHIAPTLSGGLGNTDSHQLPGPEINALGGNDDNIVQPTNMVPRLVDAWRTYLFYRAEAFGLAIKLTQIKNTQCGHYFALVAPRGLIALTHAAGTSGSGDDYNLFPPFARTVASIAASNDPATTSGEGDDAVTGMPYPSTNGQEIASQMQRIAHMKESPYTLDWCYFPAARATDSQYASTSAPEYRYLRANVPLRRLRNTTVALPPSVESTSVSSFASANPDVAELYYGPQDEEFTSENPPHYRFWAGTPASLTNPAAILGYRLICIPEGPSVREATATTGFDISQAAAALNTWDMKATRTTSYTFFQPSLNFMELATGNVIAPQSAE